MSLHLFLPFLTVLDLLCLNPINTHKSPKQQCRPIWTFQSIIGIHNSTQITNSHQQSHLHIFSKASGQERVSHFSQEKVSFDNFITHLTWLLLLFLTLTLMYVPQSSKVDLLNGSFSKIFYAGSWHIRNIHYEQCLVQDATGKGHRCFITRLPCLAEVKSFDAQYGSANASWFSFFKRDWQFIIKDILSESYTFIHDAEVSKRLPENTLMHYNHGGNNQQSQNQ